jgi:hypothetical protein
VSETARPIEEFEVFDWMESKLARSRRGSQKGVVELKDEGLAPFLYT